MSLGEHETRQIGAPATWLEETDGPCVALSVHDRMDDRGHPQMVSAWALDDGDLEKLQEGAPVWLSILGERHPVVWVYVGDTVLENRSPARAARIGLLESADIAAAAEMAEQLANLVNEKINAESEPGGLNVASSLLARALIANALLQVAAKWWSDVGGGNGDPELCARALRTFLFDLPPGLTGDSHIAQPIATEPTNG